MIGFLGIGFKKLFKHITFYFGDPTVWLGLRGLLRPEIKRKVVTARRGDVTRVNKRLQKQDGWRKRMDGKPETEQMDGDGQRQLSLSIHPVFYLTRQPFHTLCKESKNRWRFFKFQNILFSICLFPTSLSPSPVTALLAQMCHGLSINLSSPRVCDTFTLDIASLEKSV